jgi:hypothetical protein
MAARPPNDLDFDYDTDGSSSRASSVSSRASVGHGGHELDHDDAPPTPYSSRESTPENKVNDNHGHLPRVAPTPTPLTSSTQLVAGFSAYQIPQQQATAATTQPERTYVPSPVCVVRFRRLTTPVAHRSIGITPYLAYQMLRPFGFPKRLLVFPPPPTSTSKIAGPNGAVVDVGPARGLAQFDDVESCENCIGAFARMGRWLDKATLTAYCEVHIGGGCPDVFGVTLSIAVEQKVFATANTPNSLIITPSVINPLGPLCGITPLFASARELTQ